jgi:2-amino-4-hydroxy-6-hydroxymethyldihydropteridine diphosphokinase
VRALLGLGTNLGDRAAHLRSALDGLAGAGVEPRRISSVWETEPVDAPSELWFWNMAAAVDWGGPPIELLDLLLALETRAGRRRSVPGAPRTLDLDLLLLGETVLCDPRLTLPHPRMWRRRFVLAPLAEIAPDARNPASGRTAAEELARLDEPAIVRRLGPLASLETSPL